MILFVEILESLLSRYLQESPGVLDHCWKDVRCHTDRLTNMICVTEILWTPWSVCYRCLVRLIICLEQWIGFVVISYYQRLIHMIPYCNIPTGRRSCFPFQSSLACFTFFKETIDSSIFLPFERIAHCSLVCQFEQSGKVQGAWFELALRIFNLHCY